MRNGRPPKIPPAQYEELRRSYLSLRDEHLVAAIYHVSLPTLRRHLIKTGIDSCPRHRTGPQWGAAGDHGLVAKWLRSHPGTVLPRSPAKIARLVGCSPLAARSYIRRKRTAVVRFLRELPDLERLSPILVDPRGLRIPSRLIGKYKWKADPWTFGVTLETIFQGRTLQWHFTLKELRKLAGTVLRYLPTQRSGSIVAPVRDRIAP